MGNSVGQSKWRCDLLGLVRQGISPSSKLNTQTIPGNVWLVACWTASKSRRHQPASHCSEQSPATKGIFLHVTTSLCNNPGSTHYGKNSFSVSILHPRCFLARLSSALNGRPRQPTIPAVSYAREGKTPVITTCPEGRSG